MKLAAKKYNKIFLIYDIQGVRLMIKKIAYLIPACMTLSVAMAEPSPSGTVLLSLNEMDQITAGLSAGVDAAATAQSSFFAYTNTTAGAFTAVSNPANPALGGYVEVAGGEAVAVTAGQAASTSTSVSPTTSTRGMPGTYTSQVSGQVGGQGGEINVNILYTTGPMFNPF
jgi:hypothetical protein